MSMKISMTNNYLVYGIMLFLLPVSCTLSICKTVDPRIGPCVKSFYLGNLDFFANLLPLYEVKGPPDESQMCKASVRSYILGLAMGLQNIISSGSTYGRTFSVS